MRNSRAERVSASLVVAEGLKETLMDFTYLNSAAARALGTLFICDGDGGEVGVGVRGGGKGGEKKIIINCPTHVPQNLTWPPQIFHVSSISATLVLFSIALVSPTSPELHPSALSHLRPISI